MKASDHEDYTTLTIISVLVPIVGLILGVVYLTREKKIDKKLGEHLLAFSLLFMILYWVALSFVITV